MHIHMKQVALSVSLATIIFVGTLSYVEAATPVPMLSDKSAVAELTFWNSIMESGRADDYRTYLENFPNGMFVDPAMERFEKSGGSKSDLSPEVISASLNTGAEPAITQDVEPAPVQAVAPKPMQKKATVKVKKKTTTTATRTKKKPVRTVRKAAPKCAAKSIYDSKCMAAAKPKKKVAVRKTRVTSDGGGGSGGGGGGSPGGGWGG